MLPQVGEHQADLHWVAVQKLVVGCLGQHQHPDNAEGPCGFLAGGLGEEGDLRGMTYGVQVGARGISGVIFGHIGLYLGYICKQI